MKNNEILSALEPVIRTFNELGILYYIGSSIAGSAYGTARTNLIKNLKEKSGINQRTMRKY